MDPDIFIDMIWPEQGLDTGCEFGGQRQTTARQGQNVRTWEPLTDRSRGGQRPGLTRYIDALVVADPNPFYSLKIQHLNIIVDPQAEAMGGDDGTDDAAGNDVTRNLRGGLGGYSVSRHRHRFPEITLTLSVSSGEVKRDGTTATVTVTAAQSAAPLVGVTITLTTSPSGKVGDGASGVTNGAGQAAFTVSDVSSVDETIDYTGYLTPVIVSNTDSILYTDTPVALIQTKANNFGSGFPNPKPITFSLAFDLNVTAGNLLIVGVDLQGHDTSFVTTITDSLGNTYTQINSYADDPPNNIKNGLWYAVSVASGACTVGVSYSDSIPANYSIVNVLMAEYMGITGPDNFSTNIAINSTGTLTTGNVAVSAAGDVVVGLFHIAATASVSPFTIIATTSSCTLVGATGIDTDIEAETAFTPTGGGYVAIGASFLKG